MAVDATELEALAGSWEIHLAAGHKSPRTIRTYLTGLRRYAAWCAEHGLDPDLEPGPVKSWMASMMNAGLKPATVQTWLAAVRAFAAWLAAEEGTAAALAAVKGPKLDEPIPDYVTPDQFGALLRTCEGRGFHDVRDRAILGMLNDSGARASELLSMTLDGTNLRQRTARVESGKGGKGRVVAYSAETARDLDRYLRARRGHRLASVPWVWLPLRVSGNASHLTYPAMYRSLRRRAEAADPPFALHPHMLRAAMAIRWRLNGGSTESMMTLAGWRDLKMVRRYTAAADNELALAEARRLFDAE